MAYAGGGDEEELRTVKGSGDVDGIHTDIACTEFQNLIFIVISQYEKFGTMVHVSRDIVLEETSGMPTFTTRTVLGEDDELTNVVARNLASKVASSKPILFALALKDKNPTAIKHLAELMTKHKCW